MLITYIQDGKLEAFYTNWFDAENHFNAELGMVVYNLIKHIYTTDGINWSEIKLKMFVLALL
jgi:hypothetical protein